MMDDLDREVCYELKDIIINALKVDKIFTVDKVISHDPSFTLELSCDGYFGRVKQHIEIKWGGPTKDGE